MRFFFICFTIIGVKKIVCYTWDLVIKRFVTFKIHCKSVHTIIHAQKETSYVVVLIPKSKWNLFQVFGANKDRLIEVKNLIDYPFTAVALRFHPTAWSGDMCMRVEVFGCDGEFFNLFSVHLPLKKSRP